MNKRHFRNVGEFQGWQKQLPLILPRKVLNKHKTSVQEGLIRTQVCFLEQIKQKAVMPIGNTSEWNKVFGSKN